MKSNQRNYRATFILDNRGKEETIDQIIEGVKKVIADVKGEVTAVENIGKKDFVRVTDKKRDDLQAVIAFVRCRDFGVATNFKNFRD